MQGKINKGSLNRCRKDTRESQRAQSAEEEIKVFTKEKNTKDAETHCRQTILQSPSFHTSRFSFHLFVFSTQAETPRRTLPWKSHCKQSRICCCSLRRCQTHWKRNDETDETDSMRMQRHMFMKFMLMLHNVWFKFGIIFGSFHL